MSDKKDGSLARITDKKGSCGWKNRQKFFKENKINSKKTVAAEIVHGNRVGVVDKIRSEIYPGVDGLVTNKPGIFLSVTVADCAAVYFWDPKNEIVGICHAGWRGIVAGVVLETIEKMRGLGSYPSDMFCALSPLIGKCHFEVGAEVANIFKTLGFSKQVTKEDGKFFVDLKRVVEKQLLGEKIKRENIFIHPDCTYCERQKYFSFRRSKGKLEGVMLAGIKILNIKS